MTPDLPFTLQLHADLPGHDERAWHAEWNPARPLLASCSTDKTVRVYAYRQDPHDQNKLACSHVATIETGHAKTVRCVAWTPSGGTLATASFDACVYAWERRADLEGEDGADAMDGNGDRDGDEWECVSVLDGPETECKGVAYSATGGLIAACSRDKSVWIWEVKPDGDHETVGVTMEHSQDVKCVAWNPAEEILASASYDDTIKLYVDDESEDWFCFTTLTGHSGTVWSLAWAPRGDYLASCSDDLTIRIWRRVAEHAWEFAHQLEGHTRSVYSVSWGAGEGDHLGWIASTGSDGKINVWEISESPKGDGKRATMSSRLLASVSAAHGVYDVNSVRWCPRSGFGNLLCTTGDDGSVKIWKLTSS